MSEGGGSLDQAEVLRKIALADVLDDEILGARPGDKLFPLRLFFGELSIRLADDTTFTLASGLNFFFRASMDDEAKTRVGVEVSRLFYEFAQTAALEADVVPEIATLLAQLMTTQLERLRFEAVDRVPIFDSTIHERADGSDRAGARVKRPLSFLCRVASNNVIRAKAKVMT